MIDTSEVLPGITLSLFRDDGDGLFNPSDWLISGPIVTDAWGGYAFPGLEDAAYFVQQEATTDYLTMVVR